MSRIILGNIHTKYFQRVLSLMAAVSNVISFGLIQMRPLHWWLKSNVFSQKGNLFCMIMVMGRCLRSLTKWRKPWFLNQGLTLGVLCHRAIVMTDLSLTGWGAVVGGASSPLAYKLPRDVSGVSGTSSQSSKTIMFWSGWTTCWWS